MASSPISSRQIDGKTLETVTGFIFWVPKSLQMVTTAMKLKGNCSLEEKLWELNHKEGWMPKNWCFWTVMLEKTLENPLDCKKIKSVNPKGNQSWILIGRTDAKAPIFWPPDARSWLIRKDFGAGKDWRQNEKGMTQHEMVGWYHWLNGHEFEQALGDGKGQGSLACCSPWGHNESDMTDDWTTTTIDYKYTHFWKFMVFVVVVVVNLYHILSHKSKIWRTFIGLNGYRVVFIFFTKIEWKLKSMKTRNLETTQIFKNLIIYLQVIHRLKDKS